MAKQPDAEGCDALLSEVLSHPALLIYSKGDGTIPPDSGQAMYDGIGSTDKELLWLTESGHNIPMDASRQQAFEATSTFIHRITA